MPTAPYRQSRSALRERYGSRSIDGGAPQSAQDQTPSGRLRYMEQTGMGPDGQRVRTAEEARNVDAGIWRQQFPNPPQFAQPPTGQVMAPPLGRLAAAAPQEFAQPDDILKAYSQGAVTGQFKTPYGPVSFDATQPSPLAIPLRASSPVPASDISAFLPAGSGGSITPPWKSGQRPAYLSGAIAGARRWT